MKLISRKQAKIQSLPRYFTDKPCKCGHISERYTGSCKCCTCHNILIHKQQAWKHTTPEQRAIQQKRYLQSIKDNPDGEKILKLRASQKRYNTSNQSIQWRRNNIAKLTANSNKYRATKLKATPAWCETVQITQLYEESRNLTTSTGINHHVDHIVPLQSNIVCGLHCIANLQILTASENLSKHNTFE